LFGEGPGRYLVEVDPVNADRFAQVVPSAQRIGKVTQDNIVQFADVSLTFDEIEAAWKTQT